ncbi:Protein of unknown function [Nonomuraea maritima]|uniref:DUF3040 domain-containing protein n=1 Tax=Nonomuraea maritima TaxID=683260 RepID=A0A1G9JTT5_9ACTN|nr:DUF3040 domain-containing protein [Nonomuraea maritima]SDL40792.1 Protein of unknown function [Nonomuraea maritima]
MGLSWEERQALDEIEQHLAQDDPRLHARMSGARRLRAASSSLQVWCMLALLTCAVMMMGLILLVTQGERSCSGIQVSVCAERAGTAER